MLRLALYAKGVARNASRGKISTGVCPEMAMVTPRKRDAALKASARLVWSTVPSPIVAPSPKRTENRPLKTVTICFSAQMIVPPSCAS